MSGGRLIVFVDRSGGVYALIAVEEGRLDRLAARLTWVEHFKKLRRREKKGYIRAFPRRLRAVRGLLAHARVFNELETLKRFLWRIAGRVKVLCLDDSVYGALAGFLREYSGATVVRESKISGQLRRPMLLTDSLANYGRLMLQRGRPEKIEEITR